ncbi:MAG: hypothetical protein WA137_09865 [Methanothrix sp.]|jgi:hypothetical protein
MFKYDTGDHDKEGIMAGALVHLLAGIICLAIIHIIHFKWEYSLAAFVGNFAPDVIKFGVSAVAQSTMDIINIRQDPLYLYLSGVTSNTENWFTLGFFVFGATLLLYHFHHIKKKKMEEYDELYAFLLFGIIVHLIMDVLIIEKGPWI